MNTTQHASKTPAPVGLQHDHVLVPIDGTELSTIALRTGRALAKRLGATLHTVSVAPDLEDLAQLGMSAAAALEVAPTDERVHTVHSDDPPQAIATLADQLGSCIVCMSTHAHGRLAGAVLGSAARELLHVWGRPVVMVGPLADRPQYLGDTWAAPLAIDRVVVCVDADHPPRGDGGSPLPSAASELVGIAGRWATALAMSLTILTVAMPKVTLSGTGGDNLLNDWTAHLAKGASTTGLDVDVHVEADPIGTVEGVRSYLAAHPAGLLVVSTQALDGLDRLIHGATAAGIIAASTIATLVVPIPHLGEPS